MSEHHFEIETAHGVIRGMVHKPGRGEDRGTVVLVHGYFSANRVGPARLFVEMARALCVAGFSVYRADVLGVGDSDGHFEEITFVSELRDVRSVFEHVVEDGAPRRLVAVGHSMGANLALRIAIEFPQISKVVLIAPDLVKRGQVDQLFTEQQLTELRRVGWTMRKGLHINNTFVEELRAVPALTIAGELRRPVVVIQGSEDELYEQTGAEALAQRALCGRFVEIGGAEHNFLYPDARRALFECVINECHIPPD